MEIIILGILLLSVVVGILWWKFGSKSVIVVQPPPPPPPTENLMPIKIYYGSQQGTASRFAGILADEANKFGFIAETVDLIDANIQNDMTEGKVGIFCMATHGEGDPTDNAKSFMKLIQTEVKYLKSLSNLLKEVPSLKGFRFTLFGLGNTQYEHYNKIGRESNSLLEKQGAVRIFKYGEGDANQSLEEDFQDWKTGIWEELKSKTQDLIDKYRIKEEDPNEIRLSRLPSLNRQQSKYKFTLEEVKENALEEFTQDGDFDFQTKAWLKAQQCQIQSIKELRQNNEHGSTLHIVINNNTLQYRTAQNLGVYPENEASEVKEVARLLKENLDTVYAIQGNQRVKLPFPSKISVRQILTHFCDFTGPLMKTTLKKLSGLSNDPKVKEEFDYLVLPQGKEKFNEQILNKKKTIIDLLQEYKIEVSLLDFIDLVPRISPRLFTIASSNIASPNQIHLADSLVLDKLENGRTKLGLCSAYFLRLQQQIQNGQEVSIRVDFRESSFKLPDNPQTPVVMIGPGTGIAPFIGFLQERSVFLQNKCKLIIDVHLLDRVEGELVHPILRLPTEAQ